MVERENYLGGNPKRWQYSLLAPDLKPAEEILGALLGKVEGNPRIELRLSTGVTKAEPAEKGYTVTLKTSASTESRAVSAVVLATGFDHFDSRRKFEYGYGRYPDVLDFKELEVMLHDDKVLRPSDGKPPRRIAWVLCVGSRDVQIGNPWCCRMGCVVSIKQAVEVRQKHPEIEAYIYYMDIRTYGLWEDLYWKSMQDFGVKFIRGRIGSVTLAEGGSRLLATGGGHDPKPAHRSPFRHDRPRQRDGARYRNEGGRGALLVPVGPEGFLTPSVSDLNPVDSGIPGLFFAGAATGPKAIPGRRDRGDGRGAPCLPVCSELTRE